MILLSFGISQQVFADHSEVTIVPAAGSGAPGCEETADGCYIPTTATVDVGGVVIMSNTDTAAHTYTSGTSDGGPDGIFDTSLLMAGGSFEWSPTQTGEYPYFCMVHPWMQGTIIVLGPDGNYIPSTPSAKVTSNEIGSAEIEYSIYNINRHEDSLVKIFGKISNPQKGSKVAISITTPEYDSDGQHVFPTEKGYYELYFPIDYSSPEGTYQVLISYSNSVIGKLSFDVTHDEPLSISPINEPITTPIQSVNQNKISIPKGTGVPGCENSFSCYLPFSVNIEVGETITWSNDDTAAHTVTSGTSSGGPTGIFDSSLMMAGESFSVTFEKSGSYDYFCMVHPWMTGTIDVIDSPYLDKVLEPEPLQIPASFVDTSQDPWYYVERYENEQKYKDWFDYNYPEYSSIYEAVGLDESQKPPSKTSVEMDPEPVVKSEQSITETRQIQEKNPNIKLVEGQWVEYTFSFQIKSDSPAIQKMVEAGMKSGGFEDSFLSIDTNEIITFDDIETIKVEVKEIKSQTVVFENTITTKNNQIFTSTVEQPINSMSFLSPITLPPPDSLYGSQFQNSFQQNEFTSSPFGELDRLDYQGIKTIRIDGKQVKTHQYQSNVENDNTSDFGSVFFEGEYDTNYHAETGIPLKTKLGFSIFGLIPLVGDFSMDISFRLNPTDYYIPSEDRGGCLIATAAYGSELAPQVQKLREIRDNSLLQTESGTKFMGMFNDFYYSFSPTIADYERENPVFREMVKITITPMISSLSILNYVEMDSEESVLGYGISLIILNLGIYFGIPAIMILGIKKRF